MRAVLVVVMIPSVQRSGSLARVLVGEAIGPFAQRRLDEAFSLAMGRWPIGSREAMAYGKRLATPS